MQTDYYVTNTKIEMNGNCCSCCFYVNRRDNLVSLFLFFPCNSHSFLQLNHMRKFLEAGGNLLILLSEGEKRSGSNISSLLQDFGITVNNGWS